MGLDNNVINKYFREYFPKAVAVGAALRAMPNGTERLVYTTHSWLVNIFLDCPASIGVACPSLAEIDTFKAAVAAGDITWHAMPHNGQTELYDEDLLQFAVRSTHDLDQAGTGWWAEGERGGRGGKEGHIASRHGRLSGCTPGCFHFQDRLGIWGSETKRQSAVVCSLGGHLVDPPPASFPCICTLRWLPFCGASCLGHPPPLPHPPTHPPTGAISPPLRRRRLGSVRRSP